MIQRKQTIYLLLAVLLAVLTTWMPLATVADSGQPLQTIYSLWALGANGARNFAPWPLFLLAVLSASLSLIAIFLYKKRMLQARLCTVNLAVLVAWYIALVAVSKHAAPDAATFSLSLSSVLPLLSALLIVMARKAIIADERLVRAADRIR